MKVVIGWMLDATVWIAKLGLYSRYPMMENSLRISLGLLSSNRNN